MSGSAVPLMLDPQYTGAINTHTFWNAFLISAIYHMLYLPFFIYYPTLPVGVV
jgi:hypothetical protein